MTRLFSLFAFIIVANITIAQTIAQKITNQLLLPERGAVFRGYDFYTLEDEIDEFESTISNSFDDLNLFLGYELKFNDKNSATIEYFIDLDGIVEVVANVYTETPSLARDVYSELKKHYDSRLGKSELSSDGWLVYRGTHNESIYKVNFKILSDSTGDYVGFDIYLE
jgi:hypothetical protein